MGTEWKYFLNRNAFRKEKSEGDAKARRTQHAAECDPSGPGGGGEGEQNNNTGGDFAHQSLDIYRRAAKEKWWRYLKKNSRTYCISKITCLYQKI